MVRIKLSRSRYRGKELVDIDFENMVVYVKEKTFNIYRDKDNENIWLFSPSTDKSGLKALTEGTSKEIEQAYIQWTLEHTILGA